MANRRLRGELADMARGLHGLGALSAEDLIQFETVERVVPAPEPMLASSSALPPNRILSVTLQPGEDVEWVWTSTADGSAYVSGYRVVRAKQSRRNSW